MTPTWVQLANLLAAVLFIFALKGLSSPKSARNGNLLGAAGAVLATAVLFVSGIPLSNILLILAAVLIGSAIGWISARRVQMTQMPQLVALFNGVGGGAAAQAQPQCAAWSSCRTHSGRAARKRNPRVSQGQDRQSPKIRGIPCGFQKVRGLLPDRRMRPEPLADLSLFKLRRVTLVFLQ